MTAFEGFVLGALFGFLSALLWHWHMLAKVLADVRAEFGRLPWEDDDDDDQEGQGGEGAPSGNAPA